MYNQVYATGILSNSHYGFRKAHSTELVTLEMKDTDSFTKLTKLLDLIISAFH